MPTIPPTTAYELEANDRSPCCNAQLVLVSPPIGYECRECGTGYTLAEASDNSESDSSTSESTESHDTDAYTCAGTTSGDEPCTREVDAEGDYCWQHP